MLVVYYHLDPMWLVLAFTWLGGVLLAQDLAPPKGWTVEKQPGVFRFQPEHVASNQRVEVAVYDSEPSQQDLIGWLRDQMKSHQAAEAELNGCRPRRRRQVEASCVVSWGGADHYWYAFKTQDGQYRLTTVLMAPATLATIFFLRPVGQLLKDSEANVGHAGGVVQPVPAAQAAAAPPNPPPAAEHAWPKAAAETPAGSSIESIFSM
jgi:hypothetical protein